MNNKKLSNEEKDAVGNAEFAKTMLDLDSAFKPWVKPKLKLLGRDGNAFAILGAASREAKRLGWSEAKIRAMISEATSGDYVQLLATITGYFDVY